VDALVRIKRLLARRRYRFSEKALDELEADGLEKADAVEAVLNAQIIKKVIRSRSPRRGRASEKLYVIESFSYTGTLIYTKGKIGREADEEVFYFYISAKRARFSE
jgi:hypothetical protein